jgi:hypothetical protein
MHIAFSQSQHFNFDPKSVNLPHLRSSVAVKFGGGILDLRAFGAWAVRKSRDDLSRLVFRLCGALKKP